MTRVLTIPEHIQDVGLAVAELLQLLLITGQRNKIIARSQSKVGLKITHYFLSVKEEQDLVFSKLKSIFSLPDGSLH